MMVAFVFAAVLVLDPRPTADLVAVQVQKSYAESLRKHPAPTKESMIAGLEKKLMKAEERKREVMQMPAGRKRAPVLKAAIDDIKAVKSAIEDVKSGKVAPPDPEQSLDSLDMTDLTFGSVGDFYQGAIVDGTSYRMSTQAIIDAKRAVMTVEKRRIPQPVTTASRPVYAGSFDVILANVDTDPLIEGQPLREGTQFNLVVVGKEKRGSRTMPVLEVFDPTKPFE